MIKEDLWHIKLHATDENTAFIDEYIEYQKEKIAQSSIELFIGNLFLEMGEYDKAERYFDTLLTSSNPNDEEIACLFFNFGRTHRSKGDFSRAINCYNRAYQLHMNARPKRPASAGKTLNGVGVVYSEQGRQSKAEQCFKAALDLYKTSLPKDHVDVAGTLMNLGIIESNRKNVRENFSRKNKQIFIYHLV
jgi:tetratricopeptide (TPR) repeat protein